MITIPLGENVTIEDLVEKLLKIKGQYGNLSVWTRDKDIVLEIDKKDGIITIV